MKLKGTYNRILCVSDLHAPWYHKDTVKFLSKVKRHYDPDMVVFMGDEIDESDPDCPGAGDESKEAKDKLKPLYNLFPDAKILNSNHGSLAYRKAKTAGLPEAYIKDLGEVLDTPKWEWFNDITLQTPLNKVYFHHGLRKNGLALAKHLGMCVVQGHYHTEYGINYASSPSQLYWNMQTGCMLDDKARAFAYNKLTMLRPVLGCGIILYGNPHLLPMVLDKSGRWNGKLP